MSGLYWHGKNDKEEYWHGFWTGVIVASLASGVLALFLLR